MSRPLPNRLLYRFARLLCRMVGMFYFRLRSTGGEKVPSLGGLLVLSHHQSMLDPVLVGSCTQRMMCYLGRENLFHKFPSGWIIRSLGGFPIDRDGLGLQGIKETLRRLKNGEAVLIFPEGTRSADGEVHPFKPGFTLLARRAKAPIIVVAMDGSTQALPRGAMFPRPIPIHVAFSDVILPETIAQMSDDSLMAEVFRQMQECHALARAKRLGTEQKMIESK